MNIILSLGLTVFLGALAGKLCQRFKIPQVTGYIIMGLLLGKSGINLWPVERIMQFTPVINLALGIIGFMIGSELKFELFRNRGRSIYSILFCSTFGTFFVVFALVSLVTQEIFLGLLFGAIASATAPAATVDVLWEYKSRGVLTSTLLAIVALDDALALVIYGFASAFAKSLLTKEHFSFLHSMQLPFKEIGIAVAIGVTGGFLLYGLTHFIKDRERILPFSLGVIILAVGVATFLKSDLILSSMILGLTLTNLAPIESKEIFDTIKKFSPPIYILFFALVGARLDISLFSVSSVVILSIVYVFSRSFGKITGAFLGGFIGKAQSQVTKYLGVCLFSQAGVAIGMAISISQNLTHLGSEASQIGAMIINVVVATTFVFQLIGPVCVRWAVNKAEEAGRDVTEEDIIESYRVGDLIEKDVPIIKENTPLYSIVEQVKASESYHFCVVDDQYRLLGVISLGDLRDVLLEQEIGLARLVLAKDIAVPSRRVIFSSRPLKEAINIFRLKEIDFLPVVEDETSKKLQGIIHYREVMAEIHKEFLYRQGKL